MEAVKKPEILAPAGNMDALKAAVNAKADAVYLGGNLFGARAYAGNFNESELLDAIDYCHLFGIKVYMTINTLLKEEEIPELIGYVTPYYKQGLDGVIVQDLGVAKILKDEFQELPLHASTQMSISSEHGAKWLKEFGFKRIVPARELSLDEIKRIKTKTGIEIETFVHGAMCFAYSGKCLLSSFSGGRSGNRGRCAQPCRMKYKVGDKSKEHIMSLKDMCTLSYVPMLCDAGIDSFKIEGRMKNPEYVASAVSAYVQVRDEYISSKESGLKDRSNISKLTADLEKELNDIFNRGGFSKGYYLTERGREMLALDRPNHNGLKIGKVKAVSGGDVFIELAEDINKQDVLEIRAESIVEITSNVDANAKEVISLKGRELRQIKAGDEVYRTRNNKLLQNIRREILEPERKLKVNGEVFAITGQPLGLKLFTGDEEREISVCEKTDIVQKAANKNTTGQELVDKLMKTAGTNIEIVNIKINISEDAFVPMSTFNNLRRRTMENLKRAVTDSYHR